MKSDRAGLRKTRDEALYWELTKKTPQKSKDLRVNVMTGKPLFPALQAAILYLRRKRGGKR